MATGAVSFGYVERRGNRFRARYSVDGRRHYGPRTFPDAKSARRYLATVEADLVRGTWDDGPGPELPTLTEYGTRWVAQRAGLKASTRRQYEVDFRRHVEPYLGRFRLDELTPDLVRQWHAELAEDLREELGRQARRSEATNRDGAPTVARAYRLLRTILGTAVEDELLPTSPCRIKGAGSAPAAERPTLSPAEVARLADEVPAHYRALVLVAAYGGPRIGELAALRVRDLRLGKAPALTVEERVYRVAGTYDFDAPKSRAGRRTVALPAFVAEELARHLREHRPDAGPDELVFCTRNGGNVLATYSQVLSRALARMGRSDCRVHDLRHSGSLLAAEAGATLPELMQRLGHGTVAAAQVYLHAAEDHGRAVAEELGRRALAAQEERKDDDRVVPLSRARRRRASGS